MSSLFNDKYELNKSKYTGIYDLVLSDLWVTISTNTLMFYIKLY